MNDLITPNYQRGIADVTRDIRAKTGEFLRAAIEIGRLLFEAKAMVEPGGWGKYIEEELPFSQSWANNYMKLYTEFGSDQTSLFGDSQAYMNLRPSQALEIIRLPEGEREEFMQTHDVESMSSRQLKAAIDELKEAKADLQAAQAELEETEAENNKLADEVTDLERENHLTIEKLNAANKRITELKNSVDAAEKATKAAEESKQKIVKQMEENLDKLDRAKEAEAKAKAALKKAQENPDIPESVMEQLRQEAEASAAEAATQEIRKKLALAENALQESERARLEADAKAKDAREKLAAAQNSAKIQNPDLMSINVLGKQILSTWNTIKGHRMKAVEADPANAAAIDAFLKKVLDAMSASVDCQYEV